MTKMLPVLGVLDKFFIGILLVIFGGIVLHAPLTVWLGTSFPTADLVFKAWKELLMIVAIVIASWIIFRNNQKTLVRNRWMLLIGLYTLLHLLLVPVFFTGFEATIAGLMIDLRYIVFFGLVLIAVRLYPQVRRIFLYVFGGGALVVGLFALLQVTVLPPDFLSLLGYGPNTIQPYLTIDQNSDFIRINGTLRGPNPLGAYAVIVLSLVAAYAWHLRRSLSPRWRVGLTAIAGGALTALWFSYSRSALVAGIVAIGLISLLTVGRKLPRWTWVSLFVFAGLAGGGLFAARDTDIVQNVLFHENEGTGGAVSSNEDHWASLGEGFERKVSQPLGAGVGSTGSASLFTDEPIIIENQYLFIAHEVGWLGLVLFLVLFGRILVVTFQQRRDWLSLAVFASGVGLALIGLLLPVWVDDTVSIVWWGLAGLALGSFKMKGKHHERAFHAKTKRTA